MTGSQDTFWRLFLLGLITALLFVGVGLAVMTPLSSLSVESVVPDAESMLAAPFTPPETPPSLPSVPAGPLDYFYRDSLPAELYEISWGADVAWQSAGQVYEGEYAARITFKEPWSGVGMEGAFADITTYGSITLAVFIEAGVSELYFELYNSHNGAVGRQALSLYYPGKQLTPGYWQQVVIPLANFAPVLPKNITAFALIAETPGVVVVDDVRLLP